MYLHGARAGGFRPHNQQIRDHPHPPCPRLHPPTDPPPSQTRERQRVRFNLTPQPSAAADSGTVFPVQPDRFFGRPEEATKSRYSRHNAGPPHGTRTKASHSLIATKKLEGPMWRALDSSRYVFRINLFVLVYPLTPICRHSCVHKYTSVYCLLLIKLHFLCV